MIGTPLALAASVYALVREGPRIFPLLALGISGIASIWLVTQMIQSWMLILPLFVLSD